MFSRKAQLIIFVAVACVLVVVFIVKAEHDRAEKAMNRFKDQVGNFINTVDSCVVKVKNLKKVALTTPRYGLSELMTKMVEAQSKLETLELPCPELKAFYDVANKYIDTVIRGFQIFISIGSEPTYIRNSSEKLSVEMLESADDIYSLYYSPMKITTKNLFENSKSMEDFRNDLALIHELARAADSNKKVDHKTEETNINNTNTIKTHDKQNLGYGQLLESYLHKDSTIKVRYTQISNKNRSSISRLVYEATDTVFYDMIPSIETTATNYKVWVNCTFEGYPLNSSPREFYTNGYSYIKIIQNSHSGQCLGLFSMTGVGQCGVYREFNQLKKGIMEADICLKDPKGFIGVRLHKKNNPNDWINVGPYMGIGYFKNGLYIYSTKIENGQRTFIKLKKAETGKWYEIKAVFNLEKSKYYDVYINNEYVGKGLMQVEDFLNCIYAGTFYNVACKEGYIDNLKVIELKD